MNDTICNCFPFIITHYCVYITLFVQSYSLLYELKNCLYNFAVKPDQTGQKPRLIQVVAD